MDTWYPNCVHQVALEGARHLSKRHEEHHFDSQPEQRAGVEGDPEMGSSAFKVRLVKLVGFYKAVMFPYRPLVTLLVCRPKGVSVWTCA